MPSPLVLLKNNDLALRARSLFLRRPRGSGIILYFRPKQPASFPGVDHFANGGWFLSNQLERFHEQIPTTYIYDLTSKYDRLERSRQSFDVLADRALDIRIEVHTSCHVKCARDITSQHTVSYSDGGLVSGGQE